MSDEDILEHALLLATELLGERFAAGAAVAFGLMGMAFAIQEQQTGKALATWCNPPGHAGVPCGSPDRSNDT